MKQIYFPLHEYTTEYRYSYYLSFLVRVFFKDERYTKIQRKDFIEKGVENGFTRRSLKNIWDKGAYTNDFITTRNDKRNLISLKGKQRFSKIALIPEMTYSRIKTIKDFKLFITASIAGQQSKDSKGRGYKNIASKTGTNHVKTAYNRIKKAEEKFGLEKKRRFGAYNGYLVQLTNVYSFGMVTYVKNKFYNSVNSSVSKREKAPKNDHIESIWDNLNTSITKKLKYTPSELYMILNPKIYG